MIQNRVRTIAATLVLTMGISSLSLFSNGPVVSTVSAATVEIASAGTVLSLPVLSADAASRSVEAVAKAQQEAKKQAEAKKETEESSSSASSGTENSGTASQQGTQAQGSSQSSSSGNTSSGSSSSSASSSKPSSSSSGNSSSGNASSGNSTSAADPTAVNGCSLDLSGAESGTIRVRQNGSSTKIKVLLYYNGSSKYYQYTIPTDNTWTSIPLQSGSGSYKVRFMQQVTGNSYRELYSTSFQVGMSSELAPYLNPSQYVVYNSSSACVSKAKSLTSGYSSDAQKTSAIYSYITANIRYDYDKMNNVASGYLPNPDSTLASGKGICFDYAALMAAMCRSQGIPCKLVIGDADGEYHAWNLVYINGSWQLYDATLGAAGQRASSYQAERVY